MKIVINKCYGGFSVSEQCMKLYNARTNSTCGERDIPRDSPALVQIIEERGSEWCSGSYAKLKVVEIPDDVKWTIQEYDGSEWIAECHRVWH